MALTSSQRPLGLGLVALAGLALLAGMWAGLVRIGWPWPPLLPVLPVVHGPLLVSGFLGLVVALERAVALGRGWGFGAPALAGLSALALLAGLPVPVSAALSIGSGLVMVAVFGRLYRLRPESSSTLLMGGALIWLVGNALWLGGRSIPSVVPWWAGFLVLTIAGERLELAQVLLPPRRRVLLIAAAGFVPAGLACSVAWYSPGLQVAGLGFLALAGWLLRHDTARLTLRRGGLPRFAGTALLLGYVWLGIAGLFWIVGPDALPGRFWYDAMVHSVFLGFAFSMILGHAPTIVPAVAGIAVPFQRRFYLPLALLHSSMFLRIVADLAPWPEARRWGGLTSVAAILLFILFTVGAAAHTRRVTRADAVGPQPSMRGSIPR